MKKCTVYYKNNSNFTAEVVPTPDKLQVDYGKVWEDEVADDTTPEDIFQRLNWEVVNGFQRPEGVRHTSMSVGDIVQFENSYFLCQDSGWLRFSF
jgi:hypothetical protein